MTCQDPLRRGILQGMTEEHAIAIARVSQMKQRPEDQRPELVAYSEHKGYVLDEVIEIHGRSAFHGKHVKAVLEAIEKHVRRGVATVVIFRHVDRSTRQGALEGFDLLKKIMDAGARVEFSAQEFLNDQKPGILGLFFDMAQSESEVKRDRKLQGNTVKRSNGELVGRAPWGYDPVIRDGVQVSITPNALGREWIPLIYGEAVAGKSLAAIAAMLQGVASPQRNDLWNLASVRRIIANTTYYGMMTGNPNMTFEALVSVELHAKANLAVSSRVRAGRGTVRLEPTLFKPVCGACYGIKRDEAPSGISPMYRTVGGGGRWQHYVCKGHGPARKSCGAPSIPVSALDETVDAMMAADKRPRMVAAFTAGDDNDERRAIVNAKIKAAQETEDYLLLAQLAQEAAKIGPAKRRASVEMVESGQTIGEHWKTLSLPEKREELRRWTVVAFPDGKVRMIFPVGDRDRSVIGDVIAEE